MANMLKLITKNFWNKKHTRQFPIGPEREAFERSRGQIVMDPENCIMCSICARRCPADAITVERATGKWELNALRCIICGECANACPKKCITMKNERRHGMTEKEIDKVQAKIPTPPAPRPAAKPAAPATAPATAPAAAPKAENKTEAK